MLILSEMIDSRECTTERGPDGVRRLKAITMHFKLEGTDSDAYARAAVEGATASEYDELVRGEIRIAPDVVDSVGGTGTWDVEVDYGRQDETEPEVGAEPSYSFDTAGGTQHITQSLKTVYSGGKGAFKAPDCQGAICVAGFGAERTVEGVDIGYGSYEWEETHYLPNTMVTRAYKGNLFRSTYKTNAAPFRGMETGEILFRGARGGKRGSEDWEISFRFAAQENKKNWLPDSLPSGDLGFKRFDKKGWDYLWFRYEPQLDTGSRSLAPGPVGIYVEKVYEEADLSALGIGN